MGAANPETYRVPTLQTVQLEEEETEAQMRILPIVLAVLATGCATAPQQPLTESQAIQIYKERQERHRIAAIPKCGPTPTAENSKDLEWAKLMYSVCSENGDLTSVPIGGPIGAPTVTIISR